MSGCGCGGKGHGHGHGHGHGRGHGHGGQCACGGHGPRVDEREELRSEGRENLGLRAAPKAPEAPAEDAGPGHGGCGCGSHS